MKKIYLLFLFCLSGCSGIKSWVSEIKEDKYLNEQVKITSSDEYLSLLKTVGEDFVKLNKNNLIPISKGSKNYLDAIVTKLLRNNQLLYKKKISKNYFIIKNNIPFYFSLPDGSYYFSSGLFTKYIRSESLLQAILATQTFRIHSRVYEKKNLVPTGFVTLEKIISLTRIPLDYKNQVNKWGYLTLKRSSLDSSSILNWIQVRNKNTLDFTLIDGEISTISREEFAFKNFLATSKENINNSYYERNSSKSFYKLKDEIKRFAL